MSKIYIALSGGVDSGAAALVLKQKYSNIVGVTLRLFNDASSDRAIEDAAGVCRQLDIPHEIVDVVDRFKTSVIDPFCNYYLQGLTPSPCLHCNPLFKWDVILNRPGVSHDAKLATGHYAGITEWNGRRVIRRSSGKDQSYFLHRLPAQSIQRTVFPIGDRDKPALREMVADAGLKVAHRPDSQEVCFVPGNYADYLNKTLEIVPPPGDIVDSSGAVRGQHRGLHHYTVGQRSGLGISAPKPLYVLRIDSSRNRLIVGEKPETVSHRFKIVNPVWSAIDSPVEPLAAAVQVRFRHSPVPCVVSLDRTEKNQYSVELTDGKGAVIAPGQGAAFYSGDVLLGGGEIHYVE